MAKFETFCDISWNVEIRALWFSELRTVVIVASLCWKPYVFKVSHFRVIHWPRGPKSLFFIPYNIFRNRLVKLSYQVLLMSVMYVEVYMNYDLVKTARGETSRFQIYRSKKAKNGQIWDVWWYILKYRDQSYMVFWIENGGNSGLVMLQTVCVQSFSFQSYSLTKGPEKLIFHTLQYISK